MGVIDTIDKWITERGSASVLDKHLALVREQAQSLEKQVVELRSANESLTARCAELERALALKSQTEEFIEHRGAYFKRRANGEFHEAVYCPDCRGPMTSLQDALPYRCKCGRGVDFTGGDLKSIMSELGAR